MRPTTDDVAYAYTLPTVLRRNPPSLKAVWESTSETLQQDVDDRFGQRSADVGTDDIDARAPEARNFSENPVTWSIGVKGLWESDDGPLGQTIPQKYTTQSSCDTTFNVASNVDTDGHGSEAKLFHLTCPAEREDKRFHTFKVRPDRFHVLLIRE
ncbi:hypothetical protein CABS01_07261 [Colletotrichum abscissum]|uniref:Uncharacterized protein n=1 Tax=Colletotrichum abscissum TaxID=1671311 RepID=A0A9P9XR70_9PEZI|nr:uncharacterized protein CABS01_07261 [Colletotrichum abscissum]KAI3558956.1 hypothetical protein CABS02_00996 [Colletotrichum abscissum]KAK1513855.1 hypothetical protein CABS01_07261 [Colletotrichum abscissum]